MAKKNFEILSEMASKNMYIGLSPNQLIEVRKVRGGYSVACGVNDEMGQKLALSAAGLAGSKQYHVMLIICDAQQYEDIKNS